MGTLPESALSPRGDPWSRVERQQNGVPGGPACGVGEVWNAHVSLSVLWMGTSTILRLCFQRAASGLRLRNFAQRPTRSRSAPTSLCCKPQHPEVLCLHPASRPLPGRACAVWLQQYHHPACEILHCGARGQKGWRRGGLDSVTPRQASGERIPGPPPEAEDGAFPVPPGCPVPLLPAVGPS